MKSSSQLFPVALIKAEVVADRFIEDTYLLKPNNSDDKSVQVALTRLGEADGEKATRGEPVILVHGSFTNRGFWLSQKGKGLASALLEKGFDPWMLELRGHGDSPINQQYSKNCVELYSKYDVPAVAEFILEQTGKKPLWIGHSLGGVLISTAIAEGTLNKDSAKGIALFGSQVSRYPLLLRLPIFRLISKILLTIRTKSLSSGKGPEQEPIGIAKEFVRWASLFSPWRPLKGKSYWKTLEKIDTPVIAFGAARDAGDPAKYCKKLANAISSECEYFYLGKKQGFSKDFGHVDMVISKEAEAEVWPKLFEWLNSLTRKGV